MHKKKNTRERHATMMKGFLIFIAFFAITCISMSIGTTESNFSNQEQTSGNLYGAWTSIPWTQTTQSDFEAGVQVNSNTSASPGDVYLDHQILPSFLYAMTGEDTDYFYKYHVAKDSWTSLEKTPAGVKSGGALAFDNSHSIYALGGGGTPYFWRYDISSNSWTKLSETPDKVNEGGALTYVGGKINAVYALGGGGTPYFWRYDVSSDRWTTMSETPDKVSEGGTLACDGSTYVYALPGLSNIFWRYTIESDTWSDKEVSDLPEIKVGWGGSLVYVPPSLGPYYNSGTLVSQVKDTGETGARWDALEWDEGLAGGTDITFDVRASDTAFLKDNATLSWTSVGGTSPVYTGLPRGRYFQWRATLTTADTTATPTLNEVRAYYT